LVFETHYLATNYASIFQANGIGQDGNKEGQNNGQTVEAAQKFFHRHSPENISVTRFSKSRLLLQAGEAIGSSPMLSSRERLWANSIQNKAQASYGAFGTESLCRFSCFMEALVRLRDCQVDLQHKGPPTPGTIVDMLPIKGLYEIAIRVKDLSRAEAFYKDVLGLQEGLRDERRNWLFLKAGGDYGMVVLQEDKGDWPSQHFAFAVSECDIDSARSMLQNKGVSVSEPVYHEWMKATSLYFDDPDGHQLELLALSDS
jgi:catechol 2,3-dioxygenase-like lactoylglutathione lyase family enzyme